MPRTVHRKKNGNKEPWLAVLLSYFITGSGHWYAGFRSLGVVLFISFNLILLYFIYLFSTPQDNLFLIVTVFVIGVIFLLGLYLSAHRLARANNTVLFERTRKKNKDPWLAASLSFMIPGLGQFYLKRWVWGIGFIILAAIRVWIDSRSRSSLTGLFISYFFMCVLDFSSSAHAYFLAHHLRTDAFPRPKAVFILIFCALLVSLIVGQSTKYYFISGYRIPSMAMAPTLCEGDCLFVRKWGLDSLKRGDLVVFQSKDGRYDLIKRLVAFGGERLEIKDGGIYINGQRLTEGAFGNIIYTSSGEYLKNVVVPKGQLFVLGDNSLNSHDSRHYGPIPGTSVIGVAVKRYWPLSRFGLIR